MRPSPGELDSLKKQNTYCFSTKGLIITHQTPFSTPLSNEETKSLFIHNKNNNIFYSSDLIQNVILAVKSGESLVWVMKWVFTE